MELKFNFNFFNFCCFDAFNRTAYGIEIALLFLLLALLVAFNRTAYGIEIMTWHQVSLLRYRLLIAPLMELKCCNRYWLSGNRIF